MNDLIDRQAAIVRAVPLNLFGREVMMVSVSELKDLPSAQPDPNCSEIPNNSDTISRQAAIDALADMHCKSDEDGYVWIIRSDAWARIDALPSVTPKQETGKWETVEDWDDDEHYQCSECGEEFVLIDGTPEDNGYYYCPHCGARMTEEDA